VAAYCIVTPEAGASTQKNAFLLATTAEGRAAIDFSIGQGLMLLHCPQVFSGCSHFKTLLAFMDALPPHFPVQLRSFDTAPLS
jgi:hypothetical protein